MTVHYINDRTVTNNARPGILYIALYPVHIIFDRHLLAFGRPFHCPTNPFYSHSTTSIGTHANTVKYSTIHT